MLIDFSVKNYASIKDQIVLSAEAGERLSRLKKTNTIDENNYSLLKNLLIFGPNGSGKSSLYDAIHLMRSMVLRSPNRVTDSLGYRPFALNESTRHTDTEFQIRFNYSNRTYKFEFSFSDKEISSERLTILKGNQESIYYSRVGQEYPVLPSELKVIAQNTKVNTLFLFNAQQANDPEAINVLRWFQSDLIFVEDAQIPNELINLMKNQNIKNEFLNFLSFADVNITDVLVRNVAFPELPDQLKEVINLINPDGEIPHSGQELYAVHKKYNDDGDVVGKEEIPLSMESRGTRKIFMIALSIINAQLNGNGKTLLFDEFDDSLHFEISKALIKIFNSVSNKNQFILTTHELQLLNLDLRTDQIYLMEKDFQGRSDLKSIFDFKDSRDTSRHDVKYMKRYIEGRFGALPQIQVDEMLKSLADSSSEE